MNTLSLPNTDVTDNGITPLEWCSILFILILVALIYSPVVTNAFNGDDFVHLKWLHQAVSQPELVWRNFHSSWLDITTAKFYRPLISIFMLADYIAWHGNGIGFHLTNLLCHLANTLLVWLVLKNIILRQYQTSSFNHQIWCLSAAALFGLYPLHPEAVTWITGRVDTIVTLFFLSAFLCYLYWRQANKQKWLYLSIAAFICGLLSKEMAIMLPAVIFSYELIFGYANARDNVLKALLLAFQYSLVFWLVLLGYIGLRAYALGTLVGGYDSTLLPHDRHLLIYLWKHSLYMLCVPFNQSLLTNGNSIITLWIALLLLSLAFCIKQMFADKESRPIFVFLCSWLVLSLVPVYKLFNIGADLQGSRLAYLATVPLSMLICFGLSSSIQNSNSKKINYWLMVALSIMVSAAGAGLLMNNCAWTKAEAASQALMQQLNDLSKTILVNTVVYIVGLPDQINGAYVCRNALDGMTKYPQISKDIHNCFNLSEIDHIFPFGYAQRSMTDAKSPSPTPRFYVWRQTQQKLEQFNLLPQQTFVKTWTSEELKSDLTLAMKDKPCKDIDFITVICSPTAGIAKPGLAPTPSLPLPQSCPYLIYKNDLHPEGVYLKALPLNAEGKCVFAMCIFPLHSLVDWKLGGRCSQLKLELPSNISDKENIFLANAVPINNIMPSLSFSGNANQNTIGYIELDKSHLSCRLNYDAHKIGGAQSIILELSPPNTMFAIANDPGPIAPPGSQLSGLSGSISLTKADFSQPGIYAVRLRAIDKDHRCTGIAGDHIIITVR